MANFEEKLNKVVSDLLVNRTKFFDKSNNAAGTRARKFEQELKNLLQEDRQLILKTQKERKETAASKKKETESSKSNSGKSKKKKAPKKKVVEVVESDSGSDSESE